jgi:hypothetical protein
VLREETREQAGLADPCLALDQHDPGPAGPDGLHLGVENRQLVRAADEMIHPSSVHPASGNPETTMRCYGQGGSATQRFASGAVYLRYCLQSA